MENIKKHSATEIVITKEVQEVISLVDLKTQETTILANIQYHNDELAKVQAQILEAERLGAVEKVEEPIKEDIILPDDNLKAEELQK